MKDQPDHTVTDQILRQVVKELHTTRTIPSVPLRLRERSVEASVDHILADPRFARMQVYADKPPARRAALDAVTLEGLIAEFGVYRGESLTTIARHFPDRQVHGFDSFVGLPEAWAGQQAGTFDVGATPPDLPVDNVVFHVGWFDQTVPEFAATTEGSFAFCHLDADLYTSTKTVFDHLGERFVPGTVVVFDEYFGYHGWQHHEHKAFSEFLEERHLTFEAIALGHMNLAVRLAAKGDDDTPA